jgi:hypothetical protein
VISLPDWTTRQSPAYWQARMANSAAQRRMHMDDARWADSQCDDDALDWHIGMAQDASWDVRWCKRQIRKLQQVA